MKIFYNICLLFEQITWNIWQYFEKKERKYYFKTYGGKKNELI